MTAYRLNLLRGMAGGIYLQYRQDGRWFFRAEVVRCRECARAEEQRHIERVQDNRFGCFYRLTDAGRKAIEDGGSK